ncbi:ABC transporter permease [uncultured Cellulomonas sp.]|uniref:ABC transporter permease n=1 Tax=uncultured Cellulomonas sp. TaxID=189682 RepID=UPI002612A12A|nr:ABC transporter permease [uncultured Cellulomonas sp.]
MITSAGDARPNPWLSWPYVRDNWGDISEALGQHVGLTLQAVLVATAIALPLAVLAHLRPRLAGAILGVSGALYTVPSLALFALVYPFLLDARLSVLIGLVMYALLVLVRNVLVGLQGVPEEVRDAARGLGYRRLRMLLTVELPHATPAVVAGLRLATVTTVALVTIGVVVGYGGLGQLLFRGFQSDYHAEIMTATLLCVALALVADVALRVLGHLVTPWLRTQGAR